MTKRNRWLKKQARKIQRLKQRRKAYVLQFAKYIHEHNTNKIPFPSLVEDLRNYANAVQNTEEFKKAFGHISEKPPTILPRA